ncbi:MAG TPA: type II toxin-antitoxin system VapC family toxin [Longimicrobium sp.]|nr:type II toxin-antitoxin system VapC family toxin [Longimicrobium sp.]
MDRPTVYIETSIISYLAARPSRDPVTARNQRLTHEWWNTHRHRYELYASPEVVLEAGEGDQAQARQRLAFLAPLSLLSITSTARALADDLLRRVPLPLPHAKVDALHIAIAAEQKMAYLLTWDGKHIANPRLRPRIQKICSSWGCQMPELCTPATLLEE